MRKITAAVAGLAAALLLAFSASSAMAYPATISPGGAFTATSSGKLNLIHTGVLTLNCNVVLRGSLNTSIAAQGNSAGNISAGTVANCESGYTVALSGLSWNLQAGALASTTATINVQNAAFTVSFFGSPVCTYSGTVPFTVVRGANNSITIQPNTLAASCGGSGTLRAGSVFTLDRTQTGAW